VPGRPHGDLPGVGRLRAELQDGLIRFTQYGWHAQPIEPSDGTAVLTFEICLETGTPAGEYPLTLEYAELVDDASARRIDPALVSGTVTVPFDITDDSHCTPRELNLCFEPSAGPLPAWDLDWNPDSADWPRGELLCRGRPGTTVRGAYFVTLEDLVAQGPDDCAQGWQLSFTAEGGTIESVTASHTDVADDRAPGEDGGFGYSELTVGEGNEGAVSVAFLHLRKPWTTVCHRTSRSETLLHQLPAVA